MPWKLWITNSHESWNNYNATTSITKTTTNILLDVMCLVTVSWLFCIIYFLRAYMVQIFIFNNTIHTCSNHQNTWMHDLTVSTVSMLSTFVYIYIYIYITIPQTSFLYNDRPSVTCAVITILFNPSDSRFSYQTYPWMGGVFRAGSSPRWNQL